MNDILDDIRQTGVVTQYEMLKYLRSKKFAIFYALIVLVIALVILIPYLTGESISAEEAPELMRDLISFVELIVIIGATLFGATAIVSEFEERTALVLFTRPVKKSSVLVGKFVAAFAVVAIAIIVYYLLSTLVIWALTGRAWWDFATSLCLAFAYAFGCTGFAVLLSSVTKKGSTAAIMTLITFVLLLGLIAGLVEFRGVDVWFMLNVACNGIEETFPAVIEYKLSIGDVPVSIDAYRDFFVMVAWGIVTAVGAFFAFQRREL